MAEVIFDRVSKRFGSRVVIPELDLRIEDGELLVLLGPSGCGKSTLLRMLAGLEALSGGDIRIGGRTVTALTPQQRNIAMVFQNYALYPHMSVRGNLAFPLRMRRMSRAEREERVQAAARTLGIEALLDKRPAELSGGQRQRVAMGRAIVREPEVFLMDEPLSNLDARLRVQIRTDIAALQQRMGVTTLYVTHDQVEAMTLGHRVAVMRDGRIQQVGPPRLLYEQPLNVFVAGFVGSPPMNLFRAHVERDAAGARLRLGPTWVRPAGGIPAQAHYAGLRPEAFRPTAAGADAVIQAEVVTVEALGHEQIVYFRPPEELLEPAGGGAADLMAARLAAAVEVREGGALALALDAHALHWFDAQGERIT
jgi:multiple sugar transport system ATP-binding protein